MKLLFLFLLLQDYEIVLRGGHVIDPANGIDRPMDVAVDEGRIAAVAEGLPLGSFLYAQVEPALDQGFSPDTLSTDLHRASMNAGMKDMTNVMSKLLNLGVSFEDVIESSTSKPAAVIRRDTLGRLSACAEADVAVLRVRDGAYGFIDSAGYRRNGGKKIERELTLPAGEVVWDLNGIAARLR